MDELAHRSQRGAKFTQAEVIGFIDKMVLLETEEERFLVADSLRESIDWDVLSYFVDHGLGESTGERGEFLDRLSMALKFVRLAEGAPYSEPWDVPKGLHEPPGRLRTEESRRRLVTRWKEYVDSKPSDP